jgi:hypothetical protein
MKTYYGKAGKIRRKIAQSKVSKYSETQAENYMAAKARGIGMQFWSLRPAPRPAVLFFVTPGLTKLLQYMADFQTHKLRYGLHREAQKETRRNTSGPMRMPEYKKP